MSWARGRMRRASVELAGTAGALVLAVQPLFAEGHGIYESVPVREREQHLLTSSRDFEPMVERRGYLYEDAALQELVEEVGGKLTPEPADDYLHYRFHIFRNPQPNAFALPDGQVYVHTGMLAVLENEAQLAMLLAHELNHPAGHHTIQHYRSARRKIITGTVLVAVFGDLGVLASSYALNLAIIGYGRDLEEEADRRALPRVFEAGYDVREAPRLFEILNQDPEGEQFKVKTKWSSHPQLADRAAYLREAAAKLTEGVEVDDLAVGAERYDRLTWNVALLTVDDFIRADYPRSAVALATRLVAEHEGDARAHLALGDARRALGARAPTAVPEASEAKVDRLKKRRAIDRARLTREEREAQRLETEGGAESLAENLLDAEESYRKAVERDPTLAEAHRGLGLVLLRRESYREAGRELAIYVKARPDAPDKAMVLEKIRVVTDALRDGREGGNDADQEVRRTR